MTTTRIKAEGFPDLADEVIYPRILPEKMAWLAEKGERRSFAPGEVLYEQGLRDAPFFVIESGRVDFIDHKPGKEIWIAEADAGTFIGDIATFTGEPAMAECVAAEQTDTIAFDREGLRAMLAAKPEMGELVLGTLLARRAWHEGAGHGVLRLIAERGSRRAFEVRDLLERNLVPLQFHDVNLDPYADKILDWLDIARERDTGPRPLRPRPPQPLRRPARPRARPAGGGGRAALRPGRARRRPGRARRGRVGADRRGCDLRRRGVGAGRPGGHQQPDRELPGFPSGISGAELTRAATLQARRFDAVLSSFHRVVELTDGPDGLARVNLDDGQHVLGRAVVMATGARWRELAVPDIERYRGAGLYHAAMPADAERFRDEDVLVVGGGNSAGQAATHLARHARSVRVAVRGDGLSSTMSRYLVDRLERTPRVEVMTRTEVTALHGRGSLDAVTLRDGGRRGARARPRGLRDDRRRAVHGGGGRRAQGRRRGLPALRPGGGLLRRPAGLAARPTGRPTCSRRCGPGSSPPATCAPGRPTGSPARWETGPWPPASRTRSWTADAARAR